MWFGERVPGRFTPVCALFSELLWTVGGLQCEERSPDSEHFILSRQKNVAISVFLNEIVPLGEKGKLFLQVVNSSLFGGSIFFFFLIHLTPFSLRVIFCHSPSAPAGVFIAGPDCCFAASMFCSRSMSIVQAEISHLKILSCSDSILTLTHCHFFVSFQHFGSFYFCSILEKIKV